MNFRLVVIQSQGGVPNRFYFSTRTQYFLLQIAVTTAYRRRIYTQPYYRESRHTGKISIIQVFSIYRPISMQYNITINFKKSSSSMVSSLALFAPSSNCLSLRRGRFREDQVFNYAHTYVHSTWTLVLDLTGQDTTQTL